MPRSFADLAEKVTPAVVNISSVKKGAGEGGARPSFPTLPEDSPLSDLLRRFWDQQLQRPRESQRALGSGFIIDPAGYIGTNNHVIDEADEITVTLQDGREFKAKVVGADRATDLALLKIDGAGDLPHVSFGDSSRARVGDWVMAVGNPFGLGGTVTVGVLSARNRELRGGPYDDYLQIDAPINRGNSGGPLFDLGGSVIGVNTAIYSTTGGGNIGIGFAIPADLASRIYASLREKGKVERGWLGVYIQPMNEDLARTLSMDRARGALVAQVQENSPAAKAGLKSGDVVLDVDGKTIDQSRDLARIVAEVKPGSTIQLTIWRDKREQKVSVAVQELTSERRDARERPQRREGRGAVSFGFAIGPLNDHARDAFGIPRGVEGVLITHVAAGSPAEEQGLQAGDVVVAIGGEPVTRTSEAMAKLDALRREEKPAVLLVSRQGVTRFVVVKTERG